MPANFSGSTADLSLRWVFDCRDDSSLTCAAGVRMFERTVELELGRDCSGGKWKWRELFGFQRKEMIAKLRSDLNHVMRIYPCDSPITVY